MTGARTTRGGGTHFDITATTLFGLEDLLAEEASAAGAVEIKKSNRAVMFKGDLEVLYRANLTMRTASRVLVPVHSFEARDEKMLYDGARAVDWSRYLDLGSTFAVDSVVHSRRFRHANYAALKVKDAIADQFRERSGRRPSVDRNDPDLRVHLHIDKMGCTISLDSSGEPLHRRGYRLEGRGAPLGESLAAGMIMLTGWDGRSSFFDPMCGSGTLVIEAALIAAKTAPGLLRKKFSFMRWKDFDRGVYSGVRDALSRESLLQGGKAGSFPPVAGADISGRAVSAAAKNARRAGLEGLVEFRRGDIASSAAPPSPGVAVMNPPYGERMGKEDIPAFYKKIGDALKQGYEGYDAWILSSNISALKSVGLHPSSKIKLFNGPLECRFYRYSIYQGSRKGGRGSGK